MSVHIPFEESTGEPLGGGRFADPVRSGHVVRRRCGPGARNAHAFLRHLGDRGVDVVPRVLGASPGGRYEYLSYLEGESGFPPMAAPVRSDEALADAVRIVRRIHDASVDFVAPGGDWHRQELAMPVTVDCVGHLDLAPWNFLFRGAKVTGVIDWDTVAPTSRAWDLSYLAYQFAPLHADDALPAYGWDEVPDRRARLELIARTYGEVTVAELVDLIPVRLAATAALMQRQVDSGDPAYQLHASEDHARGWRHAAVHVITTRDELVIGNDAGRTAS